MRQDLAPVMARQQTGLGQSNKIDAGAPEIRVVTKISSCRVNTTNRRGIKRLGISFGSIFFSIFQ